MNIKDFKASLEYLFKAEITPFIWGHAGIGKSSIVKQYAAEKGYHFFPFYLGTQSDLGDVLGLADFVRDKNGTAIATTFATPKWLKDTIDYCLENPTSGAVIFLDEFNRARRDILNGMFSLALDKTFHTLRLPKNCHIIAAGNPPTDEYYVTDINETALMARFVHIKLEPSFDEWYEYAKNKGFNETILSFYKQQPELLSDARSNFDLPIKVDNRTAERWNNISKTGIPVELLEKLLPGIIGLERTVAYIQHLKTTDKPLSGQDVLDGNFYDKLSFWSDSKDIKASLLNITAENVRDLLILRDLEEKWLDKKESSNLMDFFQTIPKDISYPVWDKLIKSKKENILFKKFYQDPLYEKSMIKLLKQSKGIK